MRRPIKIALLAFAGSENTLGLSIVTEAIRDAGIPAEFVKADHRTAKSADYLFVSLYWWLDVYSFVRFLIQAGIDPRKPRPHIIVGGMMSVNPRPIAPYFHTAFVGDGEVSIADVITRLEANEDPAGLPGVWSPDGPCVAAVAPTPSPKQYVDLRKSKTTRIEIARGCKGRCPFCQLAFMKPYRELPLQVVRHLVLTAETKNVALFAPDRMSYSKIRELDQIVKKAGKRNMGSDARLEILRKMDVADSARFGVEGFTEAVRKRMFKVTSNDALVDGVLHVANELKTPKGKSVTSGTMYMIADLPGERCRSAVQEFWEQLSRIDAALKSKFTLFLSVSSFAPSPFTPLAREAIDPWLPFNEWYRGRTARFDKLVIADRGGLIAAPRRLLQMATIRGDQSMSRFIFWVASKAWGLTTSTKNHESKAVVAAVKKAGFEPERLWSRLDEDYLLPWSNIHVEAKA